MDTLRGNTLDYLEALRDLLAEARGGQPPVDHALASLDAVIGPSASTSRVDLPHEIDYLRDRLAEVERARQQDSDAPPTPPARPAYDQAETDELGWCIECGQVCGHAGHRHAQGDHGETVCEQCGVTLDPIA